MKETNVFLHKFLPILGLVFFILFILLINNSFASINFSDKDINYSFPSNPYSDNRPFFISKNFEKQTLDILVTCRYTLDELKDIYNLTDDKDYKLIYSLRFTENSGVKYVFSWMLVSVNEDGSFTTVKDLSDAMKPFYKAEDETGNEHFGMGLNICKTLCEKHGGSLQISNESGAKVIAAFKE